MKNASKDLKFAYSLGEIETPRIAEARIEELKIEAIRMEESSLIVEDYIDKKGFYVSRINKQALIDKESKNPSESFARAYRILKRALAKK